MWQPPEVDQSPRGGPFVTAYPEVSNGGNEEVHAHGTARNNHDSHVVDDLMYLEEILIHQMQD